MAVPLRYLICRGHGWRRLRVRDHLGDLVRRATAVGGIFGVALRRVLPMIERVCLIDVHERVEAFVYPGIATLVAAHDHREPGMADLVRDQCVQVASLGVLGIEVQARILHAARRARLTDGYRIGVWIPL